MAWVENRLSPDLIPFIIKCSLTEKGSQSFGRKVYVSRFRLSGLGFRVEGRGSRVQGPGEKVYCASTLARPRTRTVPAGVDSGGEHAVGPQPGRVHAVQLLPARHPWHEPGLVQLLQFSRSPKRINPRP
jgi:hypothetical protein